MVKIKYSDDTVDRVSGGTTWAIRDGYIWIYEESGRVIRTLIATGIKDVEFVAE